MNRYNIRAKRLPNDVGHFRVAASPFAAIQTQLTALDFSHNFPMAASHVKHLLKLQQQLRDLLLKGGFDIRKWRSNSSAVMEEIPQELHDPSHVKFLTVASPRTYTALTLMEQTTMDANRASSDAASASVLSARHITPELHTICYVVTPTSPDWIEDRFSSCSTDCGVTAWILRFLNNIQACKKQTKLNLSVFLFLDELKTAV